MSYQVSHTMAYLMLQNDLKNYVSEMHPSLYKNIFSDIIGQDRNQYFHIPS